MSIPETPQEQVQHLSKKLQQSIQSRKQIEDDYRRDSERYSEFVNQLCLALNGVDNDLDSIIHQLRSQIQQNASAAILDPLIEKLSDSIADYTIKFQQQTKQTTDTISNALAKLEPSTKQAEKELASIEKAFEKPTMALTHYLPLVNRLLNLSHQCAVTKNEPKADAVATETYQAQLFDLLSEVEFSGNSAETLQQVKTALQKPQSLDTLMTISLKVMRLIFNSVNEERKSAQSFLQQLNASLESVNDILGNTVGASGYFAEQRSELNEKLKLGVSDISDCVHGASEVFEMKETVGSKLKQLGATLEQHILLQNHERENFTKNTSELEDKLRQTEAEVERYKRELAQQKFRSLQDALTKLPNRSAFEERLNMEFARWQKGQTALTIAIADVDFFKDVNDNFGHIAGDKTLQVIAGTLNKTLKNDGFVCRYGGEEFAIIFCLDENQVKEKMELAREKVANIPFKFKTDDIRITVSAGVASFKNNNDTTVSVFERADKALYQAKENGRNNVILAPDGY